MIIKSIGDVRLTDMPGYEKVSKGIVIGPVDGSNEIVMRYFRLESGGASSPHAHDFPHLVRIIAGNGVVADSEGVEHGLQTGDYVFIPNNEAHYFANRGRGPFDFICIVPRRGET